MEAAPAAHAVQAVQFANLPRPESPAFDRPRRAQPGGDPFFDKPYEATGSGVAAWEAANKAALPPAGAVRGLSPNIKAKRKVASLLGGSQ